MARMSPENGRVQDLVSLVLALCLFASPWVLGFAGEVMPAWSAWIAGAVLAAMALLALTAFAEWEEWVDVALGAWLIAAPWVLGFTASMNAFWTHVAIGALTIVASGWAVWDYRHTPHATA